MSFSKNIIRDNIHLDIYAPDFIFDLIDTSEFQRLRRIKQLGGAFLVYPGANHTRFQHSIGVMHNVSLILDQNKTHKFNSKQQKALLVAALLHDIGHGPLSHSFEDIVKDRISHEKIGMKIILSKDSEINKALIKNKIKPQDVVDMFSKKKNPIACQILSSHIDADRMDYLVRDAVHTGTTHGLIDKEKLIRSMDLSGKEIIFKNSAIAAIESFIFARYQAFRTIYLHRIGLIHQEMVRVLFLRLSELKNKEEYKPYCDKLSIFWDKKIDIKKYLSLDDEVLNTIISELTHTSDEVIKDLSKRIRDRKFFDAWKKSTVKSIADVKKKLKKKKLDFKYYYIEAQITKHPYSPKISTPIKIVNRQNKIVSIDKESPLIKNLSKHQFSEKYIIVPKGILK